MRRALAERVDLEAMSSVTRNKPWLLIFAGASLAGHRRAERIATQAELKSLAVLLFDGHSGHIESDAMTVVDYSELESDSIPARMARYVRGRRAPMRWLSKNIRRMGTLLRPFWGWLLLRPAILRLAPSSPPVAIAYCDDSAIPLAWHAARIWKDVRIISEPTQL